MGGTIAKKYMQKALSKKYHNFIGTEDLFQNKGKFCEKWVFEDFWFSEMVSVCT